MQSQFAHLKCKIPCQSRAYITDYQYNSNGTHLAMSDSEGNVYIYQKAGEGYIKTGQFNAENPVWKVCWAHPKFGKVLAIGTFNKKVAIYQDKNNEWIEMAFHCQHEGSVNSLCWAPISYGVKLYAGGSDGKVSLMELVGNSWRISSFIAHQWLINSIAVEDLPLNENENNYEQNYPRIATASKDNHIRIWAKGQQYQQVGSHNPHKQMIRSILWRPIWGKSDKNNEFELISCSEDGTVKILTFDGNKGFKNQYLLVEQQLPITRISQSLTGNTIVVSTAGGTANSEVQTYVYQQKDTNQWECLQNYGEI